MLRPQVTPTREMISLDGLWDFKIDKEGVGRDQKWMDRPLPDAQTMAVPASFNDLMTNAEDQDFHGDVWYQRTARVPKGWDGSTISVYFSLATHKSQVWVNGTEVGTHEGGYLPFDLDLTGVVEAAEEFQITVCLNNELTFQTIPPGVKKDGKQRYFHDFFNYSGIARPVKLLSVPKVRLVDTTVLTDFEGTTGKIEADFVVAGGDDKEITIKVSLLDEDGTEITSGTA